MSITDRFISYTLYSLLFLVLFFLSFSLSSKLISFYSSHVWEQGYFKKAIQYQSYAKLLSPSNYSTIAQSAQWKLELGKKTKDKKLFAEAFKEVKEALALNPHSLDLELLLLELKMIANPSSAKEVHKDLKKLLYRYPNHEFLTQIYLENAILAWERLSQEEQHFSLEALKYLLDFYFWGQQPVFLEFLNRLKQFPPLKAYLPKNKTVFLRLLDLSNNITCPVDYAWVFKTIKEQDWPMKNTSWEWVLFPEEQKQKTNQNKLQIKTLLKEQSVELYSKGYLKYLPEEGISEISFEAIGTFYKAIGPYLLIIYQGTPINGFYLKSTWENYKVNIPTTRKYEPLYFMFVNDGGTTLENRNLKIRNINENKSLHQKTSQKE